MVGRQVASVGDLEPTPDTQTFQTGFKPTPDTRPPPKKHPRGKTNTKVGQPKGPKPEGKPIREIFVANFTLLYFTSSQMEHSKCSQELTTSKVS